MHIGAKWPFIFRWGFHKPLLRIQRFIENKKCSPEKVSIIWYLQIDTLCKQKLKFIHLELPRPEQQKWVFWQMQKLRVSISKMKSNMWKNSTFFNFFSISQLIQIVLQLNFSELVLNMQIYLYKNSKIMFPHEKKKNSLLFNSISKCLNGKNDH